MANTKISDLTASASSLASTDLAPIVQTPGVGPVKMTGLQLAGGLLGSATFNAATVTTSQPVLNLSQTWNDGAGGTVTFTGLNVNYTRTAAANGSKLFNFQVGGNDCIYGVTLTSSIPELRITRGPAASGTFVALNCFAGTANWGHTASDGEFVLSTSFSNGSGTAKFYLYPNANKAVFASNIGLGWSSTTNASTGTFDLILTRANTATLQLGAADVASGAVAQTLQVQSNTGAGTTGPNFTIKGSAGTTAGGSIIFQTAATTSYAAALTLAADKTATFASSISVDYFVDFKTGANSNGTIAGVSDSIYISTNNVIFRTKANTNATYVVADAANTLALKNSTSPQIFRAYSTTASSGSYGYMAAGVTDAGVTTADTLFIGTGGAGAAMTKLALVVNGTTRIQANSSGVVTVAGSDIVTASSIAYFGSEASGFTFRYNDGANSNLMVRFAGTTSSFPALKRSSTTLQVRLADDTANAALESASVKTDAPAGGTSGTWKLGVRVAATTTLDTTQYIEVDVGGTLYKLAVVTV